MPDAAAPPHDGPDGAREQAAVPEQLAVPGPEASSGGAATPSEPEAGPAPAAGGTAAGPTLQQENLVGRVFEHVPHPRYEHHRLAGPVSTAAVASQVHGTGFFGRLNSKVGLKITLIVGTMWAAYLFFGLALYGLPQALKAGPSALVLWTSSEFLQLVLLPIIIVGQNIQAKASDARAEDTYKDAEAIMHECVQLQVHLHAQDEVLMETIDHVRDLAAMLTASAPVVAGSGATAS